MSTALNKNRPTFSAWKMGRFFMAFIFLTAFPSLGQETKEKPQPEEEIIVIDEGKETETEPVSAEDKSDAENLLLGADTRFQISARPTATEAFGFPAIGFGNANVGFQAYPELYLYLSAFGRVPVRSISPHIDAFADLDDSYIKLEQDDFVFSLGYLRTPWRVLRGAALNDRLNPVDYRPGDDFPRDSEGRVPQWGMQLKTSIFGWSTEADYFFWYRPRQGSVIMSEQNGVQIGHYQGGMAATSQEFVLLFSDAKPMTVEVLPWFLSPSLAFRARRNIKDVDVGFNVVWGYDEVPGLEVQNSQSILRSKRTLSFGGELSWTLGVLLLKAEAVVTPKLADDVGKTTLLRSKSTLETGTLSNAAFGLGIDGEYGDWLSGSFEIIDTVWFNVPVGRHVYGVEPAIENAEADRTVHRAALGLALNGAVFSDMLLWNLRGEIGINSPDILAKLDLRRDFSDTGFYAGAFATVFDGVFESPGWYRRSATQLGVFVGYHL